MYVSKFAQVQHTLIAEQWSSQKEKQFNSTMKFSRCKAIFILNDFNLTNEITDYAATLHKINTEYKTHTGQ